MADFMYGTQVSERGTAVTGYRQNGGKLGIYRVFHNKALTGRLHCEYLCCQNAQIKEDEMDRACSTHVREMCT
jgi:hypothetical protein